MDNLAYIFQRLRHGVTDGKDDFHTMTFSNIENNEVTSRSVILRGVDETKKQLIFNTDHRSPKVRAIRENPNTHCLFYHFEEKMQLRVKTNYAEKTVSRKRKFTRKFVCPRNKKYA